ncbi:IQ motif and ankyrin repeat domain-containing protein 1-like [Acipenser ruthenus]|uniref:IQ motif and ankyrin repeat domain-containing protein 1-like n=1 Tax=Acipenser ruthenus TaxID=7906 RepID=UPI002740B880|nr:IQ motif and ankyrin repeat domain-containing protein 1-like [Acipenser ruthenus]XP_033849770.3 IQ motif and ankyrin repeat domain-containing protein 1-like [Acipenser ruthenus]
MISGKAKALPGKGVGKTPMKQSTQAKKPVPGQRANTKNNSGQKAVSKSASKITTEKKGAEKGVKAASTAGIKKEVSREEKAALSIQCAFRKHLARKELAKRRKEKVEYEELMDRLEKEAFVAMVRREQEEAERERQKEEDERKKRREEEKQRKRILEAAFEGDVAEILAVLKEMLDLDVDMGVGLDKLGKKQRLHSRLKMIECSDPHGNTPLSEAAGGGHPEAITLLVENGADINTKGAFGRTPLYRAAFGGHLRAVQTLLQLGADPRVYADDGNTPEQVASLDSVVRTLQDWDLKTTESMLQKMEAERQRRAAEEQKQKAVEANRLRDEVQQLIKEHEQCQKELQKAYCELNKRISEHDKCERKNMGKTELTLTAIHDAEDVVEKAKVAAQHAEEQLSLSRLELREQSGGGSVSELIGMKCSVRELDDVLFKDVGNKIQRDGRWPLLIDPSGQASTFLRYRDTNYTDALNPEHMKPEVLRLALLGAIRFGKPLVINMMEVNLFESVENQFDQIQAGLMEQLLTKQLLQNERYLSLVQPSDDPQYSKTEFRSSRSEKFKLLFVTKLRNPPESLLTALCPIEVTIPQPR